MPFGKRTKTNKVKKGSLVISVHGDKAKRKLYHLLQETGEQRYLRLKTYLANSDIMIFRLLESSSVARMNQVALSLEATQLVSEMIIQTHKLDIVGEFLQHAGIPRIVILSRKIGAINLSDFLKECNDAKLAGTLIRAPTKSANVLAFFMACNNGRMAAAVLKRFGLEKCLHLINANSPERISKKIDELYGKPAI